MSLLNDALRKRNSSQKQDKPQKSIRINLFPAKKNKIKLYLYSILFLFFCGFAVYIGLFFFLRPNLLAVEEKSPGFISERATPKVAFKPSRPQIPLPNRKNETSGKVPPVKDITTAKAQIKNEDIHPVKSTNPLTAYIKAVPDIKKPPSISAQKEHVKSKPEEQKKPHKKAGVRENTIEHVFFQKALSYHRRNDLENAIRMYREVLIKSPNHLDALLNLASIFIERNAFIDAFPLVKKSIELNPENPRAYFNLALTEIGLERTAQAIVHLDKAEELGKGPSFDIFFHRGVALSRLNQLDEALKYYEKAKNIRPNHHVLIFNMAVIFDKLAKFPEAVSGYGLYLENASNASAIERGRVKARMEHLKAYIAAQSGNT